MSADGVGHVTSVYEESMLSDGADFALKQGRRGRLLRSVVVKVEGTTRYGEPVVLPGITLSWAAEDIAQVHWKSIDKYRLIDLARIQFDASGSIRPVHDWCFGDGEGSVLTPRFCSGNYVAAVQALGL